MNYRSKEKYSSSRGSVSRLAGCARAFAPQAQKHLAESREFCRPRSSTRERFTLRILEFDEVADTIPCRPARQRIGLGCDILGFRISVFKIISKTRRSDIMEAKEHTCFRGSGFRACQCTPRKIGQSSARPLKSSPDDALWTSRRAP